MNVPVEEFIKNGTQEFIDRDFRVTVEFSTTPEKIGVIYPFIRKANQDLRAAWVKATESNPEAALGRWTITTCEVCNEYSEGHYLLVEIERIP
jgi:hypothetical protein